MGLFQSRGKRKNRRRSKLSITRFFGPSLTVGGIAMALGTALMGGFDLSLFDTAGPQTPPPKFEPTTLPDRVPDTIRIATFNIESFGQSKMSNPDVMAQIATIVSQFDVIAIQEVKHKDAAPIAELIRELRSGGADYAATVSEPIGDGNYYEMYAFLWDRTRVMLRENTDYVVSDPEKRIAREPMSATFQCLTNPADTRRPFSFTLINSHTDPDEVKASSRVNEIAVLADVFVSVANYSYTTDNEDDCILLGDLNVPVAGLEPLARVVPLRSVAGEVPTNYSKSKTNDHILIEDRTTAEFTGRTGVLDLEAAFGISQAEVKKISDHLPVWAEFSIYEAPNNVASSNSTRRF
ncbi:MAG: endonuclease/exonuclease/phosphatase family protein [Planctomycetota bacterium]